MPKTYYDSELTGAQIEDALEAIHDVVTPSNNGKVLCIVDGAIVAKSASEWGHGAVLEPLSVTANGDYTPPTGTDGFDEVHVAVPSATLTTKSITQNGTYNASSDNADGYSSVTVNVSGGYPEPTGTIQITQNGTVNVKDYATAEVNVSGGGSAVVQPLSVTQNGTYNPPSGVDGYAPVTVNVSGASIITDIIEQGSFTVDGLNTSSDIRVRSRDYTPVQAGQSILAFLTPSSGQDASGITWQIEISFYSANDYTTPRLSSSGWHYGGAYRFTVPTGANYIRMLIGKNGTATIATSYISSAGYVFE